jgi:hypothetical protein
MAWILRLLWRWLSPLLRDEVQSSSIRRLWSAAEQKTKLACKTLLFESKDSHPTLGSN